MSNSVSRTLQDLPVPAARINGLAIMDSGSELLVYDQDSHHIHHLNRISATIWRFCDGRRSVAEIAAAAETSEPIVRQALGKLSEARLLNAELSPTIRTDGRSRRALLKKAAIAGAIPAIVSVSAPLAAHAYSTCYQHCQVEGAVAGSACGGPVACDAGWTCKTSPGTGDYLTCQP